MKKIIIIAISVLVLALGIVGVVWFMNKHEVGEQGDLDSTPLSEGFLESCIFGIRSKEQLESVCKDNDLTFKDETSQDGEPYTTIYDLQSFGELSQYYFSFDEQSSVESIEAYVILFGYEEDNPHQPKSFTATDLNQRIHEVLDDFCEMHEVKLENRFYIFSDITMLDNSKDTSYEQIMDGTARLEFSMHDGMGFYWSIVSQTMYDGSVFLMIEKSYDLETYADMITNITVQN